MILESIIKEEFDKLFEENNYNDDDIIDPTKINLIGEYRKLNNELFNSELPSIRMKWSRRKGNLGHVSAMINRMTHEAEIKHLAITSFYKMPYRIFKDTLAHEMIHVKLLTFGGHDPYNPHDYNFFKEANRINSMGLGYNITKSSEEQLGVSDSMDNGKTYIAIILDIDGRKSISVTTPKVYERDINFIFSLFQNLVNKGKYKRVEIIVIESKNPELVKYQISRSYNNKISHSPISDELLNQLLNDKVIIKKEFQLTEEHKMSESDNNGDWIEITVV